MNAVLIALSLFVAAVTAHADDTPKDHRPICCQEGCDRYGTVITHCLDAAGNVVIGKILITPTPEELKAEKVHRSFMRERSIFGQRCWSGVCR